METRDEVLVCTGAASGMGQATAREFAERGGRVALLDLESPELELAATEIPGSLALATDVSDRGQVRDALGRVNQSFGRIDKVYNAAGVLTFSPLVEHDPADIERILQVNLLGTMWVCREAIPHLRRSNCAAIVNTTSVSASIAYENSSAYAASKGALISFTRTLAIELAPHIRVNAISPGRTLTRMIEDRIRNLGDGDLAAGSLLAGQTVPIGRMASPVEMATAVCFLLSEEASYVTGVDLAVDGGMSAGAARLGS